MKIELDKQLHFIGCAGLMFALSFLIGPLWGALVTAGVGLAKEVRDSRPGGSGFSWGDLAADVAGIAAGFSWYALFFL